MNQICPYLFDCKIPKRNDLCYDEMKYQKCIIYRRYQQLGYDVEVSDLGIGATDSGLLGKLIK